MSSSQYDPSETYDALELGDVTDDDEAVQREYTATNDPDAVPPAMEPVKETRVKPFAPTSLVTGSQQLVTPTAETLPGIIIGRDPGRKGINVRLHSSTATDYVAIGDNPNGAGGFRLYANMDSPSPLDSHTGEIWAMPGSIAAGAVLTWVAVRSDD